MSNIVKCKHLASSVKSLSSFSPLVKTVVDSRRISSALFESSKEEQRGTDLGYETSVSAN